MNLLEQLRQASVPRCKPLNLERHPKLKLYQVNPPDPARYDELQEVVA
ncbi:MAG: hypothetical protein ACYCW6_09870 [Candidatus Xenobia bacterium]